MSPRALFLGLALATGCAPVAPDPVEQIEALLDDLERASRERDLDTIRGSISADYADEAGRDRDQLRGMIAAYYLRGSKVYLLLRARDIDVDDEEKRAAARVLAGMARVPLEDWSALRRSKGDAYVFDLELAQEEPGTWRVTSASWEPATLDDLIGAAASATVPPSRES